VVRKSEATGEEASLSDSDLEVASEESEVDYDTEDEEDIEDLEEEDFEPADDDEESDEDEEDDEEDEDDDEEEEEEEPQVTKRVVRRRVAKSAAPEEIQADIALAAMALISDVSKSLGDEQTYEDVMVEFNNVMDAIHEASSNGNSISKEDKSAKLKRLKARLAQLKAKLGGGGDDDDDDDDVEKSDDIFKGLTPAAAEIVRKSQELIEKNTTEQFETIAKSYGELPASTEDLGKALRFLSEHDSAAYETITKAFAGAANAVKQSSIFDSFGSSMGGEQHKGQTLEAITKNFQDTDPNLTPEQALVKAMAERPDLYQQTLNG